MIPELGHFSLILALAVTLVLGIVPLWGASCSNRQLMAMARPASRCLFLLVLLSFSCLAWAFADNDFSVIYVALHSNTHLPLVYKLTAVWGSHEGSLLLWELMLAAWTAAVSFSRDLPEAFAARVQGVLGLVNAGFLVFLLLTSNPFLRMLPGAPEGNDLNPLLQDPGMIAHPPLLYMGYVGFSVAFAFAIAALIEGRFDAAWARQSRPWTLAAWMFLTLGITLGSGWAYYELGWGGWWFWDPVENASFIPWLLGTALVHSLAVTEKRGAFRSWTVLLAIGSFSASLLGTFLVRSGVLTSVHAFASDPRRGIFILILLTLVIGSSLLLYAWRAPRLEGGGLFGYVSRESALLVNNVLLAVVTATVLLGTLYPMILDVIGGTKLSVGPPYFETVFVPLMVPVVVLMGAAPFIRWKHHAMGQLIRKLLPVLALSLVLGTGSAILAGAHTVRGVLGLSLAAWVLITSVRLLYERIRPADRHSVTGTLGSIPSAWWGMWLAHLGIGIFIIGVTLVRSLEQHADVAVAVGDSSDLAGYRFTLEAVQDVTGPNFSAVEGQVLLSRNGHPVTLLTPQKRIYSASNMPMTEASIDAGVLRDVYVSIGSSATSGKWILRLYYKPFVRWIWAGCLLMGLGGLGAALDRRYRRKRNPA